MQQQLAASILTIKAMVTFATATKTTSTIPTRAPAQHRVDHFVAITCPDPSDSCDLYSDDCRTHAQLVSPSRDPIGYFGGPNLQGYVTFNPLTKVDPKGLWGDVPEVPELNINYWCDRYGSIFGPCANANRGCIGVTEDLLGKNYLWDNETECFKFPNIMDTMIKVREVFEAKKCKPCHYPAMFAYHYWAATNPSCNRGCKHCGYVHQPKTPNGAPGNAYLANGSLNPTCSPNFDFCCEVNGGIWLGANHGSMNAGQTLILWPNIQRFASSYKGVYDVTVVCVTCTGSKYPKANWNPFSTKRLFGPATPSQFKCIRSGWNNPSLQGVLPGPLQ
ncbi:MAG: hypothetical protein SFV81_08670 [Pirellulaceae bacterium]|nr:hypothetical protein [Pirellulaceae bacterium]